MANASILAAFERMWQHITVALGNKSDANHTHSEFYSKEDKVLRYDEQVLTEEQKEQARINIGVSGSTGSSAQPDYNQNDPTAADYIKNRPFYMGDLTEVELAPEQTVTIDDGYIQFDNLLTFVEGETYFVTFNGKLYECVAWVGDEDSICIGNGNIYGGVGLGDEVPFSCDSYSNGECYLNVIDNGDYTIKITGKEQEIVKVDPKFLPEGGVGYTEKTYASKTSDILQIMNNLGIEFNEIPGEDSPNGKLVYDMNFTYFKPLVSFIPENEYTITINGVSYTGQAVDLSSMDGRPFVAIGDIDAMMSDDFSNFRYLMHTTQLVEGEYELYGYALMLDAEAFGLTEAPAELTISGLAVTETIHKISNKYLPEQEQVKSDWNENDPEADGYIANRPFYEVHVAGDVLFEEQTFEDFSRGQLPEPVAFVEGETYLVTFDGQQYECVAWFDETLNSMFGEDAVGLGSTAFIGHTNEGGNNEPFFLGYTGDYTGFSVKNSGTHTLKIQSSTMAVAKKIDKKFLPDDIGGKPDWNQNDETSIGYIANRPFYATMVPDEQLTLLGYGGALSNEVGTNYTISLIEGFTLVDGETYVVMYDDVRYDCVAYSHDDNNYGNDMCIGNINLFFHYEEPNYDTPFLFKQHNGSLDYAAFSMWPIGDGIRHYFKIYSSNMSQKEHVAKIDPKYVSVDWENVINKPFNIDVTTLRVDFSEKDRGTANNSIEALYSDVFDNDVFNDAYLIKMSDDIPAKEQFIGQCINRTYYHHDVGDYTTNFFNIASDSIKIDDDMVNNCFEVNGTIGAPLKNRYDGSLYIVSDICVVRETTTISELDGDASITIEPGIWYINRFGDEVTVEISYASIKCLDDVYIPDTIARKTDIESVIDGVNDTLAGLAQIAITGSWNDLTDKPFGDGSKIYEWLSDIEYTEKASMFVKVSDDAPDKSDVIGGKLYADVTMGDDSLQQELPIEEDMVADAGEGAFAVSEMILVVTADTFDFNGSTLTKGVWMVDFAALANETGYYYNKVQIIIAGDTKTLDEKYIPDTIARVADIEAMLGNLSDKTIYVEWNVNGEYEFAPDPAGDALVKLSDEVPSADSIIGATATITLTADEETTTESRVVTADMIVETDYGYVYGYSESSGIYFVTAESATIADTVLTRGVWCQNLAKMSGYVEFKIFKEFVTPKVTTAQVGQTIVVKAVDENGKPTEWEAVDPWVMTSTTEGSNKKFKLTVDDNGSITIAEITEEVN